MSPAFGILLALISGACDGSYGAVMKVTRKWQWENIWLLFSVTALAVFPLALAYWSVPDLMGVYHAVPFTTLCATLALGTGWGIGSVFFGLGLYALGQSFAYTVMMGIIAVGGALIPMLVTNPASVVTTGGLVILLSMAVTAIGVAICGIAGKLRDTASNSTLLARDRQSSTATTKHFDFKLAFMICLAAGLFSCMFNLAFHFSGAIADVAAAQIGQDSTSFRANSPIWALAMLGGFVPNAAYCLYLLVKQGTWDRYRMSNTSSYWLWGILMGAIFAAGITLYGVGASSLGKLGTTVAWLVFIAAGILAANAWGVCTGEWADSPKQAQVLMVCGSAVLMVSILLVNLGNVLLP